jgi:serine/threonine protein kinase
VNQRDKDGPIDLDTSGSLATRQVDQMVSAWRRGERPLAEEFLAHHPEFGDEAAIRLIYEEVCLRLEAGMTVDPQEITARFPQWREELAALLDCQIRMFEAPSSAIFPDVDDVLAGFRLKAELGRGVSGRVFLATQPSLADRPVVLKVALHGRVEHLSLARLQHMNIMPLYSEHLLQARGLQILCMPFLGGATLSQIDELLSAVPLENRTGKEIVTALDQLQSRLPIILPGQGPFRAHLARSSYETAICSIGASLADALQYAHDRDLVHMDVKPSNVLLTAEGQPMLLDFHLAREPIGQGPSPKWMGGTPGFMAPEQQRALECVHESKPITCPVDGRADIYSLGLLLYHALAGTRQESEGPLPPLSSINPRVSVGLSDIIHKCLSPDAVARYADASALATDLRRHLADLPLLGVPNRSLIERWRKSRRRHPAALSRSVFLFMLAGAAIALGSLAWFSLRQRVGAISSALADGDAQITRRQYPEAVATLGRGLSLASHVPWVEPQRRALQEKLLLARKNEKASELHKLAELLRLRFGLGHPGPEEVEWFFPRARAVWEARHMLAQPVDHPDQAEIRQAIQEDMHEFIVLWADLRVGKASAIEKTAARRQALVLLDEAEALFGPGPSLDRCRQEYSEALGLTPFAPSPSRLPASAWEHYDLGRFFLRAGKFDLAAAEFQAGLDLRPQDFWLNFSQGLCAYRTGRFQEALLAFHTCCALSPQTAECYYNRALAYEALGDIKSALKNYNQALQLNRRLADASMNQGILLFRSGRLSEATVALNQALGVTNRPGKLGEIHYTLALIDLSRRDRTGALNHLKIASDHGHAAARTLYERYRSGQE